MSGHPAGAVACFVANSIKFIGEVERGEKSISRDSLYPVTVALKVPLRDLADVREKPRRR